MSDYKIIKVIGKGAFGDAYLGENTKQKKQYVIKQVDIKNKSKQQKQHIFHEVKLLQQFNHVNIVSYRDSFIDKKGLLNIVMQYCSDGDMNQFIQSLQGNKIPEDKIVYWLSQIALAIFYMHQKKILHRDLKSPNIFILDGNIRLGDFGISKVLDHVRDLAQTNIGTPYYMSPEQYNHKPYSYKSDIWAFGCILYQMCNQRRPFQANNIQALGMKVVRGNFPPVSQCYSKDLRHLISDMLEKNPAKRPNIIQILLKPFVKKKLVQYMRNIYSKKQTISKQSLASFLQQSKRLSVVLQQKKPIVIQRVDTQKSQRQRSTSAKKKRVQQQKQKQKIQREKKKIQLENELNKHNKQRKQMAQKLKKIQQQRKMLLARKKSQKNLKSIYEKVQLTNQVQSTVNNNNSQKQKSAYQSQKYSNRTQSKKATLPSLNEQNSKNLNSKAPLSKQNSSSVVSSKVQQRSTTTAATNSKDSKQKRGSTPSVVSNISSVTENKQQLNNLQNNKQKQPLIKQIQKQNPLQNNNQIKNEQKIPQNKSFIQQKKAFKMQQQYQMQFQDCQPQQDYFQESYQSDQDLQNKTQQQFQSQNRLPTFAKDQETRAKQVQEIKNLVKVSNQAVQELSKKENRSGSVNDKQQVIQQVQQQIIQKVQNLKHQIKMKTQHINSIRNQLSNIDFELSQSQQQNFQVQKFQQFKKPNFKKKQFNPQHAIVNDRINTLKESALTILGTEQFKKFYEYLCVIKQKEKPVKRDYLQHVLGKEKIGSYHLVEQIIRLTKVLNKLPQWLE